MSEPAGGVPQLGTSSENPQNIKDRAAVTNGDAPAKGSPEEYADVPVAAATPQFEVTGDETFPANGSSIKFDTNRKKWAVVDNLNIHHRWCVDRETAVAAAKALPRYAADPVPDPTARARNW